MQLATLSYSGDKGWSAPFPALDSPRTLVLAFGWSGFADDPAPFDPLFAAYPQAKILGCSTAGEIAGLAVRDRTISVAVARFDSTELRVASAIVASAADCAPAGRELAEGLAGPGLTAAFVLSDGINVNGTELLRGLNERLAPDVVVTGGLAGDGPDFRRTWTIERRRLRRHRVVAVGLYGDRVRVGAGSRGGWDSYGAVHVVTRSNGNVLFEVDGRPALRVYKEHLGKLAEGLPATALMCPLAMRHDGKVDPIVRTILSVEEGTQSMTFAGDIPQGAEVQFMRADFDRLVAGAREAARQTGAKRDDPAASLAVAVSCVGRRLVLGARTEEEVAAVRAVLQRASALVGFYSYGELAPHGAGRCELHNQTMTLTQISER
jgi:hypothetical protein